MIIINIGIDLIKYIYRLVKRRGGKLQSLEYRVAGGEKGEEGRW